MEQKVKEQVESLKKQINDEIQKTKIKTIRDRLVVAALKGDKKRLDRIESILKVEKYDLVFIGQQGVGKTTAICHLFGLTTHKVVKIKKGTKTIEKTVVQELLSTGSGKTTICEVAIIPDESIFIEIIPVDKEDLEQLIDDFCLHQWNKWQQKNNNPLSEQEGDQINEMIPTELMRAVQNMAGLNNSELDELLEKNDRRLRAEGYTREKITEEQENFRIEILKRSAISQRTETRIIPPPDEEKKNWIQGTFNSLNYCKLKNFSIPKRINIHVNQELLNLEHFSNINSIIDTKGIGAGELRKDIDSYFQSEKSFCLLVERFSSAPANVIGLMKEYLTPESQDISSKVALFVMPRKGEPEKTPGADGTREDGINCRKRNIEDELMVQKINFSQGTIIFHDPLEYYEPKGNGFRPDPDYDESEFEKLVISERERILLEMQTSIEKRSQVAELEQLKQHLEDIKKGKGIDEQDEQLIADMRNEILSECKELPTRIRDTDDFIQYYVNTEIVKRHHMIVRAINSRYGRYDVRNIDIYYNATFSAKLLLREIAQPYKDKIIEIIKKSGMEEASSDLQILIQNLERQIDSEYDDLLRKFSTEVSGYLENSVFYPQDRSNVFWQRIQQRWGQGTGYKANVVEMYRNQLIDEMKLNSYLQNKIKNCWRNFVEEKVLAAFAL